MALEFEWDGSKARQNERLHNIAFEEAATVFGDPLSITIGDPAHSIGEERFITVGRSLQGNLLVVVHSERGDRIRVIGAREATRRERLAYEEEPG